MEVRFTEEAGHQFDDLPLAIQARVLTIIDRLKHWPAVSGAKPLRGTLAGHYRIRTGDWRIVFRVRNDVMIVRILHRSEVYDA